MKAITRNTPATGAMRLLLTVLLAVAAWTGAHADMVPIIMPMPRANYLYVPQLEYRPGVTVDVPIYLRNTDAVVSAQFDIQLPYGMPQDAVPRLSARSNGHTASFSAISSRPNAWRVVVATFQNNYLRGNDGLLLSLPMVIPSSAAGQDKKVSISNVVLTDKRGNNIATRTDGETPVPVVAGEHPDLTVRNVTLAPSACGPGKELTINYSVANIGTGATRSGWTEKFYLQGATGVRLYLGARYHADMLGREAAVSGSFATVLPTVLHVDGQCYAVVEVVPTSSTGELLTDRGNNTGVSIATTTVSKLLTLAHHKSTILEGYAYGYATLTLTRSGDWSRAETFRIAADVQNLVTCNGLTLPAQVTIPAFSAGTSLRIAAVNDQIVRQPYVKLTISSQNGYNTIESTLQRTDDDRNPLSLQLTPNPLTEGQTLTVAAQRGGELTDELDLTVRCSAMSRFTKAFSFHFDAGQSTATIEVPTADNDLYEADQNIRFTASAASYQTATATLTLLDDDRPSLAMTLSQPAVAENMDDDDNALPLVATITRDRDTEREATVLLTSSRTDVWFETSRATFAAGEATLQVPVHVADNSAVDGTREATLTAALYLAAAARATGADDRSTATATLTVRDDEQPYLTLSSRVSAVGEGSTATITVRRVQADVSAPATVSLTCDDARVSFQPTPVTIAAGSRTATTTIRVARNSTTDDAADILVRATAPQLGDAYLRLRVTDRTLPDAVCTKIEGVGPRFYAGLPTTLRATIRNYGTGVLPAGMTIDVSMASSRRYYLLNPVGICQVTTDRDLAPGDEAAFEFEAQLPQRVGSYYVWARINAGRAINELNYGNNLSRSFGYITIKAPFQVSEVSVAPEDCLPGDVVAVSGRMTAEEDGLLNGQTVRISLRGKGQNSYTDTRIDAQGNFRANVRTDRSAYGWLTVQATAIGQTEAARTTRLHVYNQSLYCSEGTRWVVKENATLNGYFTWVNLSAKPIAISSFRLTEPVPEGCTIRLTPPTGTIAAGESVRIPFTVTARKPTSEWQRFSAVATSAEGLQTTMAISYRCQATTSHLVFSPTRIRTTMLHGRNRTYAVTVTNHGLKATGPLSALAQDSWVLHDADRLASLAPGASATIHFTFVADASKHAGRTYKSYFQLKPTEGPAAGLPISIDVTGHEYARFAVRASDVYALANADYSHVAGTTVTVADVRTGRVVHTGALNAQGIWQTEQMEEGTYDITLAHARHVTTRRRIAVGPGEERQVDVFMPYRALIGNFVVRHDDEGDFYYMEQSFDIDHDAPQAIVKATIADRGFECGKDTVDITLQNIGSRTALRSRLSFPYVNGCTFTFLNDMPAVLEPGDKHILTVAYEGTRSGMRRLISAVRMYYEFDINGQTLYEEDAYSTLFGCTDGGGRDKPAIDPNPQCYGDDCGDDPDGPTPKPAPDACDDCLPAPPMPVPVPDDTWIPLPSYGGFWKLELDADSVIVGNQLGATLRVRNQYTSAYTRMRFVPEVSDIETYEWRTERFTFAEGETTGFTADGSFRRLAAQTEGSLRVVLTPLAEAAPDGRCQYGLGGQLQYIDPQTGMHMTASLYDYVFTVVPGTGEVELTYLIGRHFINDEAETEDIEPASPGIFALIARSKDETTFSRLDLAATMPTVVANTDGTATGLMAQWAGIDGQAANICFEDFSYTTHDPQRQLAARWLYTTAASAHTTDIAAVAAGVQPVAGSGTRITVNTPRELVRAVSATPPATPIDLSAESETDARLAAMTLGDAYLLNDAPDDLSLPDVVLTADGQESDVEDVSATATIAATGTVGEGILHVSAKQAGWVYVRLADPTGGLMRLTSVTRRSDNARLSPANFWQSELTPQPDYSMQQECLMHLADKLAATEEDYLLHFDERPDQPVRLLSVKLFTADGTEVQDGATTTKPVATIQVEMTGAIRNLTLNNVLLTALGRPEDLGDCTLTSTDDKRRWTLDISGLAPKAGEHSLSVKAYKFKNPDKRQVLGELTLTWTEALTGNADVAITVAPDAACGTTDPAGGPVSMGQHTFTATAAEGYVFSRWIDAETGGVLATDAALTLDIGADRRLTALFAPAEYDVTIQADHALLLAHTSGRFAAGATVQLALQPEAGYVFSHWLRNGDHLSDDAITTDVVRAATTYTAVCVATDENAIAHIAATDGPVDIYSITGICVRTRVSDIGAALRTLPAGIYVVGGQKVLVR